MSNEGQIKRKHIISKKALNWQKKYAKDVKKAVKANKKLAKSMEKMRHFFVAFQSQEKKEKVSQALLDVLNQSLT